MAAPTSAKSGQEPSKSTSYRLQERPRAFQDAFKRPSQHLQHRCCDWGPVLVPFLLPKGGPGTLKIKEFRKTSSKFCDFALFCWSRLWDSIWDPVLGAFWPSRWPKPLLEILLERPRADQEDFFSVPEPSKSAPRGLQDRSKRPPRAEEAPRWVQDASGDRF